ncbi:MAG: PmbA/TldA family metallopeptidase, partial [Anaerolineae bacterium]
MSPSPLVGREALAQVAGRVLSASQADQTEVVLWAEDQALTRFANSSIHQNVAERNVQVRVRAVVGRRTGVATGNDLRPEALERLAGTAVHLALLPPENPQFLSLPGTSPIQPVEALDEET